MQVDLSWVPKSQIASRRLQVEVWLVDRHNAEGKSIGN